MRWDRNRGILNTPNGGRSLLRPQQTICNLSYNLHANDLCRRGRATDRRLHYFRTESITTTIIMMIIMVNERAAPSVRLSHISIGDNVVQRTCGTLCTCSFYKQACLILMFIVLRSSRLFVMRTRFVICRIVYWKKKTNNAMYRSANMTQ